MSCGAETRLLCPSTTVASTASTPGAANARSTGARSSIRYGRIEQGQVKRFLLTRQIPQGVGTVHLACAGKTGVVQIVLQRATLPGVLLHEIGPCRTPAQRFDTEAPGARKQVNGAPANNLVRFQNVKDGGANPFCGGPNARNHGPLEPQAACITAGNAHRVRITWGHFIAGSSRVADYGDCKFRLI